MTDAPLAPPWASRDSALLRILIGGETAAYFIPPGILKILKRALGSLLELAVSARNPDNRDTIIVERKVGVTIANQTINGKTTMFARDAEISYRNLCLREDSVSYARPMSLVSMNHTNYCYNTSNNLK
jgi:hypothetical protein